MSQRKSGLLQFQSLSSVSMAGTVVSSVTNIVYLDNIGVQFNFTGNATGNFAVQISADYKQDNNGNVLNPGSWVNMDLDPAPAAAGVADNIYVDIIGTSAPWMRFQYSHGSGSGVLSAWVTAKMV